MNDIFWALPALLLAAVIIGWAAETAEIYIAQGLALAILAWLQVLPEFAVEAVIAWEQKQDLMIANLTGSLRLLVGLGWPLIFFVFYFSQRKVINSTKIHFDKEKSIEVFALIVSNIYFSFIAIKGSLTVVDSVFLIFFYAIYLRLLSKGHKRSHDELIHDTSELPWVGKKIITMRSKNKKVISIIGLFLIGGVVLQMSAEPFLHSLEALALTWGVSSFVFVQWVAPFVSEFPEKVTALNWARKKSKAPMAFMNIVSSNIVQWTLMAAMVPIVYSLSKKGATPIFFDKFQTSEIVLTLVQSVLSILILMDLEVDMYNAVVLLGLWAAQFFNPALREEIVYAYIFFIIIEVVLLIRKKKLLYALNELRGILNPK